MIKGYANLLQLREEMAEYQKEFFIPLADAVVACLREDVDEWDESKGLQDLVDRQNRFDRACNIMHEYRIKCQHASKFDNNLTPDTEKSFKLSVGWAWDSTAAKKVRRELFIQLVRVLMKYIESRDLDLHEKAKLAIRESYRECQDELGYKNLEDNMSEKLLSVVGRVYWHKANVFFSFFKKKVRASSEIAHRDSDARVA